MAVIGRTARHGQIEVGTVQQSRRLAGLVVQPAVDDFQDALSIWGALSTPPLNRMAGRKSSLRPAHRSDRQSRPAH
jgi:hypothetical protein